MLAALLAFALFVGWQVAQPLRAFADGPTTFSNTASIAIPATGSPDQIGPASPYPSNVSVSGMAGLVSKVTVTFHNLTHGILNDVDALVVAPGGANLVVLSDASVESGITFASNATITFDDAAATQIPGSGNVGTGSYRPTNTAVGGADSFPSPAPSPSSQTTLAGAFNGINPNGTWQLFIVDDTTGDLGTMAGGWSLTITTEVAAVATTTTVTSSDATSTTGDQVTFTAAVRAGGSPVTAGTVQFSSDGTDIGGPVALNGSGNATFATSTLTEGTHLIRATYGGASGFSTSNGTVTQRVDNPTVVTGNVFCNAGPITIPTSGASSPYPSNITVSGLSGEVSKVTVQLKGLSHQTPIDLDVLLSGPTPTQNLFLLSDAGGQNAVSDLDVTFDDAAASAVSATSLASGTYRPTRIADESNENLPAPAPAPSSATELSTFNGASANGTWSLWIVDDATGDSGSISGGWCLTITTPAPTGTALTAAPNPSSHGQSVTLTATVTSNGNPVTAGSVEFTDGATSLGAAVPVNAGGVATLTTSALAVGTHPITASYTGTDEFAESSDDVSQVVNKRDTSTALTSSANPSQAGSSVTFTAVVTANGGAVNAGSVTFAVDGTDQATVAVDANGAASFTTSALSVGSHAIEARYGGTANENVSDDDLDQVVSALDSTTVVVSAPNPSVYGSAVTFTATVTTGGTPVTAGTVQFSENATPLGPPVALAGDGTATFTTSTLTAGSHTITATFSGNPSVSAGSGTVDHQVTPLATVVTLISSASTANLGDPVTFTADVTGAGSPVTIGSVTFVVDGTDLGIVELDIAGQATFTTSALAAGSHQVVAQYGGSLNYAPADSAPLTQLIQLVADAGGPYTVAEGESVTLDGGDSTPGLSYAWDIDDDGTFDVDGIGPTLTWAQLEALGIDDGPGVHTVTLRVTSGAVSMDATAVLTVVNTSPESVITGDLTATVGVPFTLKVGADDPSAADMAAMFTYTVDWGDGSPVETVVGPADPPVTHTYAAAGTYDATFTATDKDGGTGAPSSVSVVASPQQTTSPTPSPSGSASPTATPSPTATSSSTATSSPGPLPTATRTGRPSGGLPQTGTAADPMVLIIGLGLLAVGALVIVASIIGRHGGWRHKS